MLGLFKRWRNDILIEGEKSAKIVSRIEKLPDVSPDFDDYPVDVKLPGRRTKRQAVKKAKMYSDLNIYNMFYKI